MYRTVVVTSWQSSLDYTTAQAYGSLRPLTNGKYSIFRTTKIIEDIAHGISTTEPEDYLLFSGSSVISALALCLWLMHHGQCNILLWDAQEKRYVDRLITRGDLRIVLENTLARKEQ